MVQAAGNSAQAGLAAALAERIPEERRGTASAGVGLATMVGIVVGPVLARLGGGTTGGYTLLAGAVLLSSLIFAFTTKDLPAAAKPGKDTSVEKPPVDPQQRRDFWWGFAGRAALFLAYSMISGYTLYMLEDYVGLSDHDAEAKLAAVTAVLGISTIIVMPISGVLADRSGRLKPFVIASSLIFVPGFAAMLVSPTFGGLLAGNALCGIAFGSYMAVDQALMTRILPSMDDAGRDLGVLNIAAAGPQVAAPFVASLIISALGGYRSLFATGIVLAVLGALAIKPIRSVR
nr:MFS transporter [Actinomadura violacea]